MKNIEHNRTFAQTCPHLLQSAQLENPFLVVTEFFSRLPLGSYRMDLDSWFSAALHEKLKHPDPETMHYLHQELQILFNALYLIVQDHTAGKPFPLSGTTYEQLLMLGELPSSDSRCQEAYAQPYWLSLEDREKPMDFLKKTMNFIRFNYFERAQCSESSVKAIAELSSW
ncbi:MAG: hypothetical protein EOP49_21630 [Sphingobacteriales bacterium]|nr:MAG: hypothetical protein EOP49_21630 [Sphingobacteriales bacterium]